MTGSVTKLEEVTNEENGTKLSTIKEAKTTAENVTDNKSINNAQEEQLIDILEENNETTNSVIDKNTGSSASVRVIEVKEAPSEPTEESPKSNVVPRRLSVLTSPVEQVLTENTTIDGSAQSVSPKPSDLDVPDADIDDDVSQDIDDIMTLEEVLNKELVNFSASGVCWQMSRDKKNVLSMFFVR